MKKLKYKLKNQNKQKEKSHSSQLIPHYSRGITLVALVVTIVVLLILAGVTISMLFSDNGIIKKAQEATKATEISQIKEEADLVKLGLMANSESSTITKNSLITALYENFTGSTLENGRVVVNSGKYDIIVRDNLEIVVVKHGEVDVSDTSASSEIGITYEIYETAGYYYNNKIIKMYLDVEYKSYEEYASEILEGKTEEEIAQIFVEGNNYWNKVEGWGEPTYDNIEQLMAYWSENYKPDTPFTTIQGMCDVYGYDNISDFAVDWMYVEPEQYNTLYCYDITVTCSNGETKTTNPDEAYVEFEVTEEGTYTIVATTESGKSGEAKVAIDIATTEANYEYEDSYGNKITVPGGFSIVPNGTDGVEYAYTGDGTPAVQDGVVIEDNYGNQFVWIPVGDIKNKDGSTTTITLARYTFNDDGSIANTVKDGDTAIETYYKELSSSTYGNTTAKDIEEFKRCATTNGGYYIARYEASNNNGLVASKANVSVWNNITQPKAATVARRMYGDNNYFVSDLVNSYAWDTAIVFIQTFSGDNDYSMQGSLNSSLATTGASGDRVCNIYDMASNTFEWSTETYTYSLCPCVHRGGFYASDYYSKRRVGYLPIVIAEGISFRPLLYCSTGS